MPFGLVGIMFSELRLRKTNTIGTHLYVESEEQKLKLSPRYRKQVGGCPRQRVEVSKVCEGGKGVQKRQTFSYKINKSWDEMHSMVTRVKWMDESYGC